LIEHNKVLIQDFSDKPQKGVVRATHSAAQLVGGYLIPPLRLVGTQQTQVTKLVRDQFLTLLRNILQPLLCNFFNYHFVGRKSGLVFSSHKKSDCYLHFFSSAQWLQEEPYLQEGLAVEVLLINDMVGHFFSWLPLWCSSSFNCFLGHSYAAAASIISLDILVQCCFKCFLGHSCAAAASIVFLGTFLCSCCFNCFSWDILVQLLLQLFFLGHSCSATASIVFLDILMQLLLQLFFLGHSCAAASSRFNTM
jgi:hypothetical protein